MPDKSCRTCGGDLIKWSTCTDCKKVMQKICVTCSEKTIEEIHSHYMHLGPQQMASNQETLATIQNYSPVDVKSPRKNHCRKYNKTILAVCSIVAGIIILGISATDYVEYFQNSTPQIQSNSSPEKVVLKPEHQETVQPIGENILVDMSQPSTEAKFTYNNCLGVSDGIHLTVTCPTEYGVPYKAVVSIPTELILQLESDVFNLREISITEHVDSISIQYAKKMYEAKFISG